MNLRELTLKKYEKLNLLIDVLAEYNPLQVPITFRFIRLLWMQSGMPPENFLEQVDFIFDIQPGQWKRLRPRGA